MILTIFFKIAIMLTSTLSNPRLTKSLIKDNVSIKYPEDWEISNDLPVTFFISRKESSPNNFKENINLTIGNVAYGLSLEEVNKRNIEVLASKLISFELVSKNTILLNKETFIKTVYKNSYNGSTYKVILFQCVKNLKRYNLTCTSLESTYNEYETLFEEMAKTFKITL